MRLHTRQLAYAAIATGAAYYLGALVGLALTPSLEPISALWPPNAILLGALLLAPLEWWLPLIAATFPAHLAVELQGGIPIGMALSWYVSNCAEAFIGAALIRYMIPRPVRFDSLSRVAVFVGFGAFLAPFLTSFIDVAFVRLNGWHSSGADYWTLWRSRFFSDALAILSLVPIIGADGRQNVQSDSRDTSAQAGRGGHAGRRPSRRLYGRPVAAAPLAAHRARSAVHSTALPSLGRSAVRPEWRSRVPVDVLDAVHLGRRSRPGPIFRPARGRRHPVASSCISSSPTSRSWCCPPSFASGRMRSSWRAATRSVSIS